MGCANLLFEHVDDMYENVKLYTIHFHINITSSLSCVYYGGYPYAHICPLK